jgi:hypothetical protein
VIHVRRAGSEHVINENAHSSEAGLHVMAMDWKTPPCQNLEQLERSINQAADFAETALPIDLKRSPRMPTFEQVYGDRLYG